MNISKVKGFDNHKLVTYVHDEVTGLKGYIAIHRGSDKVPAFGATRIWNYSTSEDALVDAVRLSNLMSHKAALAGLPCGGAKAALVIDSEDVLDKKSYLRSYSDRVNLLGGNFITGADVGVTRDDVIYMRRHSPFMVGFMVDPVRFTGLGIFYALLVSLEEKFGSSTITGKSIAIQGVGKVGQELIKYIYPYTKDIFVSDINEDAVKLVTAKYPKIKVVKPSEIHKQHVDIYSPCALSNSINSKSIKELNCAIIVGGANNQLEKDELANKLYEKNILYVPDYIANAGGLISVYDEYEHDNYRIRRIEKRVGVIGDTITKVFKNSKAKKSPPTVIANEMAREIFDAI